MEIPTGITEIDYGICWGCDNLEYVSWGEGVVKIGFRAFCNCVSLERISTFENVETIVEYAFEGCEKIGDIYITEKTVKVGRCAFFKFRGRILVEHEKRPKGWLTNWTGEYTRVVWNAKHRSALQ
jgi:hypothetical protein